MKLPWRNGSAQDFYLLRDADLPLLRDVIILRLWVRIPLGVIFFTSLAKFS